MAPPKRLPVAYWPLPSPQLYSKHAFKWHITGLELYLGGTRPFALKLTEGGLVQGPKVNVLVSG